MGRENNFDLVRLAAALQVAILHASEHLGAPLGPLGNVLELFPGVPVFFFISGLLVTASVMRRPISDYAAARARRIFPALWVAVALSVALLLAFGQVSEHEVRSPLFWAWFVSQTTVLQSFNLGAFRDFGVGVVNGSLWTIPVELGFYIALPALIYVAKGERRAMTALCITGAVLTFLIGYVVQGRESLPFKILAVSPLAHFWLFALGVLAYLHMDRIRPLLRRIHWVVPLIGYAAAIVIAQPILPDIVWAALGSVMLCAAVLWVGLSAPFVAGVLRGNDLSYGLYLYHMLVVNSLLGLGIAGGRGLGLAISVSLVLAALSWRYVERAAVHAPSHQSGVPRTVMPI